ncbi:MAG: respiratory chain complex I subunit 1 family protein [Dehalococcoidales bacterium]
MSTGWLVGSTIIAVIVAPFLGGLLVGIDRKLTAHMQGRIGPPIIQPFYDIIKLFGKKPMVAGNAQLVFAYIYLALIIAAVVLFGLQQDLLMLLFILSFGTLCLALGALSVKSPYSQLGGNRQLLQFLAYEPILLLAVIPIALKTGSFPVAGIYKYGQALLPNLWLTFIALLIVLAIVMRKSPFDISGSEHAHQEIVSGVVTEYSGPYLAIIELGHWYEVILLLAVLALFWVGGGLWWLSIIIALASWFIMLIVDNITARLTWSWMVKFAWGIGISLVALNILFIKFGWM